MRKLLALLLFLPFAIFANDDLEKAKDLYDQKQFKKALTIYTGLIDSNAQQPNLMYNIGNCHAQLNNLGLSILYFEKTLLYDPNHDSAKKNLIIQEALVQDDLGSVTSVSAFNKIARTPKGNFWNWLALTLSIIGGVCFVLGFKKKKSTFHIFGFGMIVLCFISMYFSYEQYSSWTESRFGVVLKDTSLKTDKESIDKESYQVNEGLKMGIVTIEEDWFQVRLNGETLWIPKTYFEKI
jgi:tetratricopeptide (TPR) repeat protein